MTKKEAIEYLYSIMDDNSIIQGVSIEKFLNKEIDSKILESCEALNMCVTPNGLLISKKNQGFLPELMTKMYNKRIEIKRLKKERQLKKDGSKKSKEQIKRYDIQQLALKYQLNSAYGALGNPYSRWYYVPMAEAITTSGQLCIRWAEKYLNDFFNKLLHTTNEDYVLASDTDSVYLWLGNLIKQVMPNETDINKVVDFVDKACSKKIEPVIEKCYREFKDYLNGFQNTMVMKREVIANKGLWVSKKRYILNVFDTEGLRHDKPKLKVMGLECVKSSTPESCREKIKEALKLILNSTENKLINFIEDFWSEFKRLPPEDIAFPRGLNGLRKYTGTNNKIWKKGCPIHVRGALVFNRLLRKHKIQNKYQKIQEGVKVKYLFLKEPNPAGTNVISFETNLPKELDLLEYIDYNTQYEKSFKDPLKLVLDTIGWKTENISDLTSFFS